MTGNGCRILDGGWRTADADQRVIVLTNKINLFEESPCSSR